MFQIDSLTPCACKPETTLNGREAIPVGLHQVRFTDQGMRMIGQGILALSREHGLPVRLITERMKRQLFAVPPSHSLYFLFHLPELEADMHVEIPQAHWQFIRPDTGEETGLAL